MIVNSIMMLLQQRPSFIEELTGGGPCNASGTGKENGNVPCPAPIDDYIPLVLLLVGIIAIYYIYKNTKQCQKE